MTNEELSNGFDVILKSYSSVSNNIQDIVLDEYEKSVFLTLAQESFIIELYNGFNPARESFEATEELKQYLNNLLRDTIQEPNSTIGGLSEYSKFFTMPSDLLFITYEAIKCESSKSGLEDILDVVPITLDEFYRISRNPFRKWNKHRALRLENSIESGLNRVTQTEIITDRDIKSYFVRYISIPTPIVLEDLTGTGLSVNGVSINTPCKLHPSIHRNILERAVALAVKSKLSQQIK